MIQAIIPILFAMMYNSTQYEPIEYPTPLFEQTELNVCLENDQDHKTYLKHVALYAPVNCPYFLYGSEMEEKKRSSGNSIPSSPSIGKKGRREAGVETNAAP